MISAPRLISAIGVLVRIGKSFVCIVSQFNVDRSLRCAAHFECTTEQRQTSRTNEVDTCSSIARVVPETLSIDSSAIQVNSRSCKYVRRQRFYLLSIQLEVALSRPLKNPADHFKCRFTYRNPDEVVSYTDGVPLDSSTLKCSPPTLSQLNRGKSNTDSPLVHPHRNSRCSCLPGDSIDLSRQNESHIWPLQSIDDQLLPLDVVFIVHGLR